MRTVSTAFRLAAFAQETGEVPLVLIEIAHDDLATPIRIVDNREDVVSGGNTFLAFPCSIVLPEDREDVLPTVQIVVQNVGREITDGVRALSTPPTVRIAVVLASSPSTIEIGWMEFSLSDVAWDALTVEGTFGPPPILNESFPALVYSPADFPGLF